MKKNIITLLIFIIISSFILIFVNNNYFMYSDTIMKVEKVKKTSSTFSTNSIGLKEEHYIQKIEGTILNGKNKGKTIKLENDATTSSVVTEDYKVGDKVFVDTNKKIIKGLKRDVYVTFLVLLLIVSIYFVGNVRGLLALVTVSFNSIVFYLSISLYLKGVNLLLLCILESIIFTIFSLVLANGRNKNTLAAIISTFVSLLVLVILVLLLFLTTNFKGINFNGMSFLTVPVEDIFLAELIIGGLGAIMDVSITMSSAINELIEKDNKIKNEALIKSGKEIGKDIMGTMINVLFFTYLCSGLPIFVLAIRNGFTVYNYITTNFSLELTRFLVGSIGIVLAIPIGLFISIKVMRGDNRD